jgi:hypothetical protein
VISNSARFFALVRRRAPFDSCVDDIPAAGCLAHYTQFLGPLAFVIGILITLHLDISHFGLLVPYFLASKSTSFGTLVQEAYPTPPLSFHFNSQSCLISSRSHFSSTVYLFAITFHNVGSSIRLFCCSSSQSARGPIWYSLSRRNRMHSS